MTNPKITTDTTSNNCNVSLLYYVGWLGSKVDLDLKIFEPLLQILHSFDFYWLVAHDENRARDGLSLRKEFCNAWHVDIWDGKCSVLEMMVALSLRGADQVMNAANEKEAAHIIFMDMLKNIGLDKPDKDIKIYVVYDKITKVLDREYFPDGLGGFFPLDKADSDQRKIEIWYQLSEYMIEKNLLD